MLDAFEVLTTSGVVVWSRTYAPVSPSIVNNFIADTFIEEKNGSIAPTDSQSAATNPAYRSDQHTLKWTFVKELGLIFVVVYRSLLHLSWVDKLVDNIKTIFVQLYGDQLTKPHTTLVECHSFDEYFDQQLRELDRSSSIGTISPIEEEETPSNGQQSAPGLTYRGRTLNGGGAGTQDPVSTDSTPIPTPDASRPSTPGNLVSLTSSRQKKGAKTTKKGRKWNAEGFADEEDDSLQLDYSQPNRASESETEAVGRSSALDAVESSTWGSRSKGKFILKDLGDEVHDILASAEAEKAEKAARAESKTGLLGSGVNTISGLFRNIVGGKTLTKADLESAMKGMEDHLLRKNVAREAAVRLCESVEKELVGVKTGNFESINAKIHSAMESSLTKMLTPTSSLDLLREIDSITSPPVTSLRKARPYVISIVGVNGVGKSTNLSKICFFLLQNKYKVLIAAGDTFRSGAVEQLAVHVRNLKELTAREGGQVELYQKGYGKDAATVAKDAVSHAAQEGYDVVLIDTAGRRHNDQRLMSSLEKFAKFAQPDKILMVGEALVGTDSVAQARNFNAAFGSERALDGFIISKCDTVGDMVGTLVSLVHATNVPVVFVGVGQHYSDLRNFSVKWAVGKLLSSN
ncbi:hypothetical protein ACSS6W_010651 [Trichoderma asperelloides]